MLENTSWLDVASFAVSIVTAVIAIRLELRQSRQLREIVKKEREVAKQLEEERNDKDKEQQT